MVDGKVALWPFEVSFHKEGCVFRRKEKIKNFPIPYLHGIRDNLPEMSSLSVFKGTVHRLFLEGSVPALAYTVY